MDRGQPLSRVPRAMLLSLIPVVAGAQSPHRITPTFRSESKAYIKPSKDGWNYITVNSNFEFSGLRTDAGDGWEANLLLEETFRHERVDGLEGVRGTSKVKAWTIQRGKPRRLRWEIASWAHEGGAWNERMVRLTTYGCCAIPTVFRYYALGTGKLLYTTHSDLVEVRGGEGIGTKGTRYLGLAFQDPEDRETPTVLQYGSDTGEPKALVICTPEEPSFMDLPKLILLDEGRESPALNLTGSPFTFRAVVRYPGGLEVTIPIVEDEFRPEQAVLPKGVTLRKL